jgi:hypothetical protein
LLMILMQDENEVEREVESEPSVTWAVSSILNGATFLFRPPDA